MAPYRAHWEHAVDVLLAPWKPRGRRRRRLPAALALALDFGTWRILVREQDLDDADAIEVAMALADE
jgi:hypothetical protein